MEAQNKLNIHQRLHASMSRVDYVQKSESNGMKYKFVSHDSVTAAVRPILVENGVIYYPQNMRTANDGNRVTAEFDVRFVNIDDPTDYIDVPTFGFGIDAQDKGPGKAMSYGVKYALLKALGLETGDDPERDSIDFDPAPSREQAPPLVFKTSDERVSWMKKAATEIAALKSYEELMSWMGDNTKKLSALGEGQTKAMNEKLADAKARLRVRLESQAQRASRRVSSMTQAA